MTYKDLGEIFATKISVFGTLESDVGGLTSPQAHFIPAEGAWSIADVVEHLALVDGQLVQLIDKLLQRTEDAGKTKPPLAPIEIPYEEVLERSRREKYVTRDKFAPSGSRTITDSLSTMRDAHARLLALRGRLESIDLSFSLFPHWIFGPFTLGQWLAFVALHEDRHLDQIHSILAMPGFPRAS
jgi:uncharacterized damage-inducible protein DinB